MSRITIGVLCYQNAPSETLEDYCRFMYYLGRRLLQHEFQLAVKAKTEQFRARNSIVEAALATGSDFLLMLDDDHVIDWEGTSGPNSRYGFIDKLLAHMDADEKLGLVGVVYYHRGNECRPVLMKEGKDGGFYYMRDDEIRGELQEVAVQGGGCMLIRCSVFDRIRGPWFEPEFDLGTDVQICKKIREAGFKVASDTSIQIGHVLNSRTIITPNNRHRVAAESAQRASGVDPGIDKGWQTNSALALYRMDAEEYLDRKIRDMESLAMRYDMADFVKYRGNLREYYANRGKEQLARQVLFHHTPRMVQEMEYFHSLINTQTEARGADIGCGSAPVTFELAMRGHHIDFIDVDGAGAYEFTKWRAKKRGISCGFKLDGEYDYVFMLDAIEHIEDWQSTLNDVAKHLKENGALVTNYFDNEDYTNPEHVSMDKGAVQKHLISLGLYPHNNYLWVKNRALGQMDKEAAA
jgi:2-polyprenyl-3-methyl-5-hydroxy-6-metoxy-1,4-benzoquinol methylase